MTISRCASGHISFRKSCACTEVCADPICACIRVLYGLALFVRVYRGVCHPVCVCVQRCVFFTLFVRVLCVRACVCTEMCADPV